MTFAVALGALLFSIYWLFIANESPDALWTLIPFVVIAFMVDIAHSALSISDAISGHYKEKKENSNGKRPENQRYDGGSPA